jgi:hypothetical protein
MPEESPQRAWLAMLATLSLTALVAWWGSMPPAPLGANAPDEVFSAGRAEAVLGRLHDASPGPHIVGTQENAAVRRALEAELRALGLEVEVQAARACWGSKCARVQNVIATTPGAPTAGAVALAAHYDGVPSGPGVSDDLAGVAAVVEVARALKGVETARPVVYLITDGEEMGLFGARGFESHPLADDVEVVVNLEARGTRGRSFVFETTAASSWLLGVASRALSAPAVNSLAPAVYERLPNGSDLTVHRDHGFEGLNFGYFAEVAHYHTPLDDMEHLSRRSLQHQGQNALEMTRALASETGARPAPSRSTYFDVLGALIVRWPEAWSPWLAAAALAWLLGWGIVGRRRGTVRLRSAAVTSAAALLALLVVVGLGVGLELAWAALRDHPLPWRGAREVAVWMYAAFAATGALGVGRVLAGREEEDLWFGVWWVLAALGVALGGAFPAGSYVFVAPALGACVAAPALALGRPRAAMIAASAWAAVVWLPLMWALLDGLELLSSALVTVWVACLALTSWCLLARVERRPRRVMLGVGFAAWVLLSCALAASPRATPERPEGLNVVTRQVEGEDASRTYLVATPLDMLGRRGPLPEAFAGAKDVARGAAGSSFVTGRLRLELGPGPPVPGPGAPTVELLGEIPLGAGDTRAWLLRVRSQRGATTLTFDFEGPGLAFWLPEEAHALEDAEVLSRLRAGAPESSSELCEGVWESRCLMLGRRGDVLGGQTERGMRLVVSAPPGSTLRVADVAVSTPEEGRAARQARPEWMTPAHVGDLTVVEAVRPLGW